MKRLSMPPIAVALLLAAAPLWTSAQDKKGVTEPELKYQAGASPLANEPMYQSTNPKAPPMTQAEFDLGRKTYFERCAGGTTTFQVSFICAMPNSGGTGGSCWM